MLARGEGRRGGGAGGARPAVAARLSVSFPRAVPELEEPGSSRSGRAEGPPAGMATCRGLVLALLAATAAALGAGPTLHPGVPDFEDCKRAPNVSVLGALPGAGWDNLRNVELRLVLQRSYSRCRTTEDGEYLVPDDVRVVTRRESAVETRAELMQRWLDYKDAWAASINADVAFLSALNGRFSADCESVRRYDQEYGTVTARVQVRHSAYAVKAPEAVALHPDFRSQLLLLSDYLDSNQTVEAQYLAELLVRNYGTHVLTDVEAGATLEQEDQVRRELLQNHEATNVSLAASLQFYDTLSAGASVRLGDQLQRAYAQNTVASRLRSHGGAPVAPGLTLQTWQRSIRNRLVTIGRAGLPLPDVLQPDALPELAPASVLRVEAAVRAAIQRYYALNAHPGCVTRGAPAFNPQANVDDGSCPGRGAANFSFAGLFQECQEVSGPDAAGFCRAQRTPNPLTGNASCAPGDRAVSLYRGLKTWSAPGRVCQKQCSTCYLFFQCCQDVCATRDRTSSVRLATSWCTPSEQAPAPPTRFLFGGLYSPGSPNPLTQAQACPDHFYPLDFLGELKVCVSGDLELGAAQALPFGGFFSCQEGNPLAGSMQGQSPGFLQEMFYHDSPTDHPMKCPEGYSQHQAYVTNGCQILYCLRAGALLEQQPAALRLPPFLPHPVLLRKALGSSQPALAQRVGPPGSSAAGGWVAAASLGAGVVGVLLAFGLWRCARHWRWRRPPGYEGIGGEGEGEGEGEGSGAEARVSGGDV